ncbi:hypothetical protein QR680_003777 [Steinernema hermaphroditum]|uniref:Calcineurin-like phosphoesterase domain-containing protein n=1 Tax=Steinernema hermaphroditum TaxID=289476 RepID=A0AA39HMJ3_9BILA|nr:hypothetical protein QR680_003777 [Steinernema hermaphroditum]
MIVVFKFRSRTRPWIVTFQHRPFYCSNENSKECSAFENRLIRKGFLTMPGLEDLYTKHGVDMGFWGHEHSYERFLPVNNRVIYNETGNPYDNAAAPIYIISGSAGCHSGHAWFDKKPVPFNASSLRLNPRPPEAPEMKDMRTV